MGHEAKFYSNMYFGSSILFKRDPIFYVKKTLIVSKKGGRPGALAQRERHQRTH